MKMIVLFALGLSLVTIGLARADVEWCDVEIDPHKPTSTDPVTIILSGWWSNSCVPNNSAVSVIGKDIYFDVIWDYPPFISCLTVITGWTLADLVGPLPPGTYTVYARVVGYPLPDPPEVYEQVADFIVSDKQFVLSSESLAIPEGATATFTVRLLKEPLGPVDVTVARESGDPDITVQSGAALTFDPCNYSVAQTVKLAAAADGDYLNGTAIILVTAPDYLTAQLIATEHDNDLPRILYVDANANGNNDGRSWTDALTRLQAALAITASYPEVEELWIAQGTYRPADPNGDRTISFRAENIILKGGFGGNGCQEPSLRDIAAYRTVLSGDLNGNDASGFLNYEENSKSVVRCRGRVSLDGITVTGGNGGSGAGIYNWTGCILRMTNCRVIDNYGRGYGGGMFCNDGDYDVRNCLFAGNVAQYDGGGLYNHAHIRMALTNCTFAQNSADKGAAIDSFPHYVQFELKNCIFWGNTASSGRDETAQINAGPMTISNCCIQGWTGILGGIGNHGADPCFVDPNNGDFHLKSRAGRWDANEGRWTIDDVTSPCIDAGDPMAPIMHEAFPNGGIINMGAYGGTAEASKSYFGKPPCEIIVAGDVNGDCIVDYRDFCLMALHWMDER